MNSEQLRWFKSSYSGDEGGTCVEVAYNWRKSNHSSGEGGNCIEVASCAAAVHIRDSKNVQGPRLDVAPGAWAAFVSYAQQG
ncbi:MULTISPECIES: DUF397 domain-containing protein [unclassified Streptomyces]|jgi:hypothetical protein|uniref:DUF397 domain-containing protein n=1 Tax=unclassified Streptomyces TaxID=2593676 RepID=UPI00081B215E|nr:MULTISPECIES: DUF397 domain-containing protein [unclassified Streptomyces]MYQ83447.1 DUF397 domain-containing protein [Streptomyces sp. SID4936]SCD66477.1 protein of unknown function [Streptomyces sp. DvalAA-43]